LEIICKKEIVVYFRYYQSKFVEEPRKTMINLRGACFRVETPA
jgi:hypothetical protein